MIHFDFILEDSDAENLMEIINNEICRNYERIEENINNEKLVKSYKNDIEYIKNLKTLMKSKRI